MRLGFLETQDVGASTVEPLDKALLLYCPDSVDVPAE